MKTFERFLQNRETSTDKTIKIYISLNGKWRFNYYYTLFHPTGHKLIIQTRCTVHKIGNITNICVYGK